MAMSDPVADLLTRIRNGQMAGASKIHAPSSKLRNAILEVLKTQGYIRDFKVMPSEHGQMTVDVDLKYTQEGEPAIRKIKRVSTPGRRTYFGAKELKPVYNGLGIAILSTTKGVISDHEARAANVGGEVLAEVF